MIPLQVKWEKDGVAVEEDDHVRLVTEGQFHCIDISPVTLEDSGVWRVRVTNSFGATTSAAQLSLIGEPVVYTYLFIRLNIKIYSFKI